LEIAFEDHKGFMPLTWTTDVIGTQYLHLLFGESVDGALVGMTPWEIDPEEGQFGYGLDYGYSSIQAPSITAPTRNIWSNHDIVGTVNGNTIKADSWYELAAYEEGTTEEVPIPVPIDPAITGGNATYDQYTTAGEMWCTAGTPEGGRLSYKWYRYTDSEENAVVCGYTGNHTPSTLTAGVWHYFCEVTNNQYGGTAMVRTVSVPITVNAVELPEPPTPEVSKVNNYKHIIGYVLKQCGVPMAELIAEMLCKETRVPVAYNYNGLVALKLPEWDATVYLYAYIVGQHLCVSPKRPYIKESKNFITGEPAYSLKFQEDVTVLRWWANDMGEWEKVKDDNYTTSASIPVPKWSNFDILKEDGTVYLAASDPIPVYE
jgi:hypothetical protein